MAKILCDHTNLISKYLQFYFECQQFKEWHFLFYTLFNWN